VASSAVRIEGQQLGRRCRGRRSLDAVGPLRRSKLVVLVDELGRVVGVISVEAVVADGSRAKRR